MAFYLGEKKVAGMWVKHWIQSNIDELEQEFNQHKLDYEELVTEVGKKANKEHEAWITPTLLNEWEERYPVGYRKNSIGQLEIKGRVRGGTLGLAVFNLPLGYRPDFIRTFLTMSNWGQAGGYVNTDGDFIINSAYQKDTWVAIDLLINM